MVGLPGLSARQLRILQVIREYSDEYGYPPTVREIGELVGISSTSVVSYNLNALQNKGLLTRDKEVSRGLRLVELAADIEVDAVVPPHVQHGFVAIPMLGAVAAGEPLPIPDSNIMLTDAETMWVTREMVGNAGGVYALQVRGESMIDALINDGDIVIMRHQQNAENGDMVAAWIKDEKATTLKHFYWEANRTMVRLQPANPLMDPIYVHPRNLDIQGKVIGVIRHLA